MFNDSYDHFVLVLKRLTGKKPMTYFFSALFVVLLSPLSSFACACGCSVFSVGGNRWRQPPKGCVHFTYYDYMNQHENQGSWGSAASSLNSDRIIRNGLFTLDVQDMLRCKWGFIVEAPVRNRYFETNDAGNQASVNRTSLADIRVLGMYTGISEDTSTAIQFGLKLPTGSFNQSLRDGDTQIGSGTIDLFLGGYQVRQLDAWGWFGQVLWEHAFNTHIGYRLGTASTWQSGFTAITYSRLTELFRCFSLPLHSAHRSVDLMPIPGTPDTAVYISPGIEANLFVGAQLFANVRILLFTHVTGYQLIAPALFEVTFGYSL